MTLMLVGLGDNGGVRSVGERVAWEHNWDDRHTAKVARHPALLTACARVPLSVWDLGTTEWRQYILRVVAQTGVMDDRLFTNRPCKPVHHLRRKGPAAVRTAGIQID